MPATMPAHELAQLNFGRLAAPLDSPRLAEFVANLDRINALAEQSPGFVWRLKTDGGDATSLRPLGDDVLINMSVWADVDALRAYVYKSGHAEFVRRRKDWFELVTEAYNVMWWVESGVRPRVDDAIGRLEQLRARGPAPDAFDFKRPFSPPG